MIMLRNLLLPLLLITSVHACAQTGIRAGLDYESIMRKYHLNFLAGVDRDVNDRISLGLDVLLGLKMNEQDFSYTTGTNTYSLSRSSIGLQYRSMYFFGGTGYIASTIGFRTLKMELLLDETVTGPFGTYSYLGVRRVPITTTIIPIGIRLGLRGELDGFYQDLYVNLGYNIGSAKDIFPAGVELRKEHALSKVWISVGYAMAVGF